MEDNGTEGGRELTKFEVIGFGVVALAIIILMAVFVDRNSIGLNRSTQRELDTPIGNVANHYLLK